MTPANELLLLRRSLIKIGGLQRGLMALAPAGGGASKDLQDDVVDAVADGQGLAALLTLDAHLRLRLEFPLGKVLLDVDAGLVDIFHMRLSPDGQRLAFVSVNGQSDARIDTLDRSGHRKSLYTITGNSRGDMITGLAWAPGGELWFSELQGDQTVLWALPSYGRQRVLWRGEGTKALLGVSPEGRVLLADHQVRKGVLVQRAGETQARDLSLQSTTHVHGLSADGRQMLLMESPSLDGGTSKDVAYLRGTEGGPALRLARGFPRSLSPDGGWVHLYLAGQELRNLDPILAGAIRQAGLDPAAVLDPQNPKPCLLFVPTGSGRPWALALPPGFLDADAAQLLPDGQRVVFCGAGPGLEAWFLMDRRGGVPQPLTPADMNQLIAGLVPLSPDGTRLIVTGDMASWFTVPVPPVVGQAPRPIPGILPGERLVGWAADGHSVFVRPEISVLPVTIHKVDLNTGARTFVQALAPPDRAGHIQTRNVLITPDARTFAFDFDRKLSQLYLVDGVK